MVPDVTLKHDPQTQSLDVISELGFQTGLGEVRSCFRGDVRLGHVWVGLGWVRSSLRGDVRLGYVCD